MVLATKQWKNKDLELLVKAYHGTMMTWERFGGSFKDQAVAIKEYAIKNRLVSDSAEAERQFDRSPWPGFHPELRICVAHVVNDIFEKVRCITTLSRPGDNDVDKANDIIRAVAAYLCVANSPSNAPYQPNSVLLTFRVVQLLQEKQGAGDALDQTRQTAAYSSSF
jgi:hypothetical protein